ncbi:hypothetical protein T440DRAFT_528919 [Plenodomus tracheiphilus IPT5]|uniref:DUF7587 domain-containing protein n=1 Tax=Plenodomus tracheiphilus IPT5 TaxID=1408161 RepID=A0A6A7ALN0_9PLEO|nr:hypothetical protein T440DRAFT_528919 [Plenodomus tracheiphilus IPT5]
MLREENLRPWRPNSLRSFRLPLLRVWDCYSGSQPDESHRMMARAPRQRLDSAESRKTSLTTHLDHKVWNPTPYISFTVSPTALKELANFRERRGNRGSQTVTVIDPNVRLRIGLPILDVSAEMEHYEIPDPYGNSNQYYTDHYVCVWEITGEEVVGQWPWEDLANDERWYEDIIMPAYHENRRNIALKFSEDKLSGISKMLEEVHRKLLS